MAGHDSEKRAARGALLIGPGRRAHEVGSVLVALSVLDGAGKHRREPLAELDVTDLEELLAQRTLEGLLILESARVPGEDIGFVRRFLERHPGWRLAVVGDDAQEARAKGLLALARAQWLPWPPDLAQLGALLAPESAPPAARDTPRAAPPEERSAPRKPARRAAPAATNGAVDLGELMEELLASAALHGGGAPRFQCSGEGVLVHRERALLQEGLAGLVELARVCAGGDGLVQAVLGANGDGVRVALEFPRGALDDETLGAGFERAREGFERLRQRLDEELAAALMAARHGAELLREAGGRVELAGAGAERLRCEVRLAAQPALAPRPARAGKAEDPFA